MFSGRKNIEGIQRLFLELKNYIELQKEYVKLDAAEKLTVVLAVALIVLVLVLLGSIILLFVTFGLAFQIGDALGNVPLGFFIVAGALLALALFFYLNRNKLVIQPVARFFTRLIGNHAHDNSQQ